MIIYLDYLIWYTILFEQFHKVINIAHLKMLSLSDLQPILNILTIFENKPAFEVTLSIFYFWKKPFYILISKDLDKQLFFIINGGKTGRCYLCFIN